MQVLGYSSFLNYTGVSVSKQTGVFVWIQQPLGSNRSDKTCSDSESIKGLGIRIVLIPRPQCIVKICYNELIGTTNDTLKIFWC